MNTADYLEPIIDEMESVGGKAKDIKDELYNEYVPAIEKLTDALNEALKSESKDSKQELSRIALKAHDVQCEIYKDLKLKLEYGKNRFEDMKGSPEYKQNAVDALRLLAFMTLAYQISCRCFAAQGEYAVCNNILQGYKEIVEKSGKDRQDILLFLNSTNVFIEQGDMVYGFRQIMQKILAYESEKENDKHNTNRYLQKKQIKSILTLRPGPYKEEALEKIRPGRKITIFDIETTGLSAERDAMVEFRGWTFNVQDDYTLAPLTEEPLSIYIKPEKALSKNTEELIGITNEFLSDKSGEKDVCEIIYDLLSNADVCIGHAVNFDTHFIKSMMLRNGKESPFNETLDTREMARDLIEEKALRSSRAGALIRLLRIDQGIGQTENLSDEVKNIARLFEFLLRYYVDESDAV